MCLPFGHHFTATIGIVALVALFHRPPYKRVTTEPRGCLITHYQALCRFFWSLGSALVSFYQSRQCPTPSVGRTFHVRRRAARLSLGCKVTLLRPKAGGSAGSITLDLRPIGTRRYMQLVGYPVTRRGRLQMSPYFPTFAPVGGRSIRTNMRRPSRPSRRLSLSYEPRRGLVCRLRSGRLSRLLSRP